ncbi:restriction endonuclease subunit S [Gluconobacter kanchanaburiensis]|uniref:restriction endonuclease subunit S n=1 Tax=Gluconobacter kanchanaburiensis TaxID=563199 RepID=UPI001D170B97|nr:restriction endonuclease subunit S [Gluconobacter kanchanaburiensis]
MLPKGWKSIALSELQTKTPSVDPRRYPTEMFDLFSVPSYTSDAPECVTGDKIGSVKQEVQSNDILLCKIVPHIRRAWSVPQRTQRRQIASGEWIVFRSDYINSQYLRNFLISDGFHEQFMHTVSGVGGSLMRARPSEAVKISFPLPPLAEQRRIVAKLDSLTARIARARAELERVPVLIERYKKNLLKRAFAGELTNKWRLMNGVSEIEMTPLSDVCTSITDGDHQAPPRAKHGVPFITISAMNNGEIDLSKATRFVPSSYLDALKDSRKAKTGDVLFSVTGSIGIPAVVKHECPFVFQRHIAILKPDTKRVSGLFLKLMLQSPDVQVQCAAVATGTAQLTVPLNRLRNFLIPLPTIAEQIEVIRLVESTFKRLERMQEDYVDADHLLSKLESSLLAKAFRGELVPQDPNDEPASVLLDRIRAERAADTKPGRKRRA